MSSNRTLYGFWISPYMAMVAHFMEEARLVYSYERVSPYKGENFSNEHRKRNPVGKVPSLKDVDGQVTSESLAICRTLARKYPEAMQLYPCDDAVRCAEIDRITDFITFSISGPYFNAFVFGAYFPQAFGFKTEKESVLFSGCSIFLIKGAIGRLMQASGQSTFLTGDNPTLPDVQLFQLLELGKTFSAFFNLPFLDLLQGDDALQSYYEKMASRESSLTILARQAEELEITKKEIFEDFGPAYAEVLERAREILPAILGHPV